MVRGEEPAGKKIHCKAEEGGWQCKGVGSGGAVAVRGVWISAEYMKWKKGTDGGDVGGGRKK